MRQLRSPQRAGFTLLELLMSIGIVAVVIGQMIPAVQKQRESVNNSATIKDLQAIAAAEKTCLGQTGSYTNSFVVLVGCGLTGTWPVNNGHTYALTATSNTFQVVASPITPASFETCTATQGRIPSNPCTEIAGANEMRGLMYVRIAAIGADAVALYILDNATTVSWGNNSPADTIRSYLASPTTVSNVFNGLDINSDGIVSMDELFPPGNSSGGINNLLPAVQNLFMPGAGGENINQIGIKLSQLPSKLCSSTPPPGPANDNSTASSNCSIFPEPPE